MNLDLAGDAASLVCFWPLWHCVTSLAPRTSRPETGPATEKRFPPLKVPAGFKATLFACDPLIEYPSVIAAGPRPGAIFVAVDYMTGLGTEIVRRSEVRLVEDTDGDGYADKATGLRRRLQLDPGLAWHDGTVYVMHAPLLTRAARHEGRRAWPTSGTTSLTGLGLPPEENPVRLHCANGVTAGHDGWLYLALGDHGCDVRPARRGPAGARRRRHPPLPARRPRPARLRHRPAEHLRRGPRRRAERLRPRQRERRRRLQDPRLPQLLRGRPRLSVPVLRAARRSPAAAGRPGARLVGRRRLLSGNAVSGRVPRQPVLLRVGPVGRALCRCGETRQQFCAAEGRSNSPRARDGRSLRLQADRRGRRSATAR